MTFPIPPTRGHCPETEGDCPPLWPDLTLLGVLGDTVSPAAVEALSAECARVDAHRGVIDQQARLADKFGPRLEIRDANGERVDRVDYHPAYRALERTAYGELGLVARKYFPTAREQLGGAHVSTYGLGYVFAQLEQGLYCPVCMTDGAARLIAHHGSQAQKDAWLPRIASRDLATLTTGAMFLTEKAGGSDVGQTETIARETADGWRLWGEKWFSSNVDAEVVMALARVEDAQGQTRPGTRGLGLFVVPRRLLGGTPNAMLIHRLKEKLGTRSMPTGEVSLEGALGEPLGDAGLTTGFKLMTEMLNLSRLYNAVASIAVMRRALVESVSYARKRTAFGKPVIEHALLRDLLGDLSARHEAACAVVFHTCALLDRVDTGVADAPERRLVRALTPLVKLATGKLAVTIASEACEVLAGNGYCETFVTPRLLRDAQVLPIWEGTTNILLLDLLRAFTKEDARGPMEELIASRMQVAPAWLSGPLARKAAGLSATFAEIVRSEGRLLAGMRETALGLFDVLGALLLATGAGVVPREAPLDARREAIVTRLLEAGGLRPRSPDAVPELLFDTYAR